MAEILATYKYTLNSDNNSYSITCTNRESCTKAIIPSEYSGLPVTSISESAFWGCTALKNIEIPNSVTSIGRSAFSNCNSLINVNYTGTIDDWAQIEFSGGYYSNPLYYANNLYINNQLVTEANITTATKINNTAFSYCSSLTSVTIGNSVTSIGSSVFHSCTNLTSVVIGDSVTSIGSDAFSDCSSLTSVVIPDSVTSIGPSAFLSCDSLTSIKVNANNTTYKDIDGNLYSKDGKTLIQYAIGKTQTTFTISNSVTSIGNRAFEYCTNLTSVTIGNNVKSIGNRAFSSCDSLTTAYVLAKTPASLGYNAFDTDTGIAFYCTSDSIELYKTATNWKSYADKFTADDMRIYFAMNSVAQKNYFASKEEVNNLLEINTILKSQITELQSTVNNLQAVLASMRPATSEAISTIFNTEA